MSADSVVRLSHRQLLQMSKKYDDSGGTKKENTFSNASKREKDKLKPSQRENQVEAEAHHFPHTDVRLRNKMEADEEYVADMSKRLKDNLNVDNEEYEDRRFSDNVHNFKSPGRNRKYGSKPKDRRPEIEHYSARHVVGNQRDQSSMDTRDSKMRQTKDTISKTKPKRQYQPLYQPRRSERQTGSKQQTKEEDGDTTEYQAPSPEAVSGKTKRPTQQIYTSKFQQSHSTEELSEKSLSPVTQDRKEEEICKPSPRTKKRPTQQIYVPKPRQQALEQQAEENKQAEKMQEARQVESSPKQTFDLREKLNESRKARGNNENYMAGGDEGQAKVFSPKSQKRNEKRTNLRDDGRKDRKPKENRRAKRSPAKTAEEERDLGNLSDVSHKSLEWDYQVEMAELAEEMRIRESEHIPDDEEEWEDEEEEIVERNPIQSNRSTADDRGPKNRRSDRNNRGRRNENDRGTHPDTDNRRKPVDSRQRGKNQNKRERQRSSGSFTDGTETKGGKDRPGSCRGRKRYDSGEGNKDRQQNRKQRNDSWGEQEERNSGNRKDRNRTENRRADSWEDADIFNERNDDLRTGSGNRGPKRRGKNVDRGERKQNKRGESKPSVGREMHRNEGRRRLQSDGIQSSETQEASSSDRNLGLKVTFGDAERKVKLQDSEDASRRRQRHHSGEGRKDSTSSRSDTGRPASPHGGGIIYLPVKNESESSTNQRQDVRHIHPAAMPVRGQTSSRGRGATHRTLYDPKNPTKHSKSNAAPQFQEVYEDSGAYATGFPEYQRTSSYDYSGQPIPPRGGFYEPEYSGSPGGQTDGYYGYGYQAMPYYDSGTCHDDTYSRDPYYHSSGESKKDQKRRRCGDGTRCEMCKQRGHKAETAQCPAYCNEQDTICFKGQDCIFSNMYLCEPGVIYEGNLFNCSETAYQWKKALDMGHPDVAARILESRNGFEAKSVAKELDPKSVDMWKQTRGVSVMEKVLEAKFEHVVEFQDELLDSGNAYLAEVTYNRFWAVGLSEEKAVKCKPEYFPGENVLGKLLMRLRSKHFSNNNNHSDQKYWNLVLPNKDYYNISYVGGYDQEISSGRGVSPDHMKAQSILRDLTPLDSQLNNILSRGIHGDEGMRKVLGLRQELQSKYEQVVLLDIDLANKHNIEQMLWKSAFYQIIEFLRKNTLEEVAGEMYRQHLIALLEEGTSFYEGLLKNLQVKASFNIEDYLDASQPIPETDHRKVKLALLSAQRTMICLGDIARYKEQANHTTNYGKARSWYMKAQQLAPKNGRPYNQLAILALYTKRKLDAVYYYMRSLAASNPFLTARESVMQLFDEARKKAAATERKKEEEKHKREQLLKEEMSWEDGNRLEIWITPDGKASEGRVVDTLENELDFISTVELNKRFVLNFLNVHGKLFTKIGMESFEDVSCQMLQEFSALIQHTPPPIGNNRLLQLMCINMFAIDNCAPKDMDAMEENCRSLTQEQAVQIGLEMFGLLAARCVLLFKEHIASEDLGVMCEDLHQLFPSVKVWSDWMMCHVSFWNPPPLQRDPSSGMVVPIWKNLADLCNVLKKVDTSYVKLYTQKKEGCDNVILFEDVMMAGFVPLLSLPRLPTFVHQLVDKEIARDCLRVDRLITFGDYLCGIEPPMLSYNVATNQYVSIAPDSVQSEEEEEQKVYNTSNDELDVIIESEEEINELNTSSGDENFQELKKRREELRKQMEEKQRHDENIEAVLQRHTEKTTRPIKLEIRPTFLVPDTNGFIDHLEILQKFAESKIFTIVIPIVVLNELDGLAKGSKVGQYDSAEHANMVRTNAEAAVKAIEAEFVARNSHWKAMTSKGTMMDTIAYRSEETVEVGTNDDLILQCCLYFCNDKARDFMPKDRDDPNAPITLQRDVVLLTDDRNLRLKAHLRNVPVKDILAFQRWAKVS